MQQESVSAAEQVRAGTALAAEGFGHAVRQVEQVHRAVARRAFDAVGPLAATPRAVHDGVTSGIYAAVRGGGAVTARALTPWAIRRLTRSGRLGHGTEAVVAAVNGAWGDHLDARADPLATPLGWRRDGADLAPDPDDLARAFPAASGHLAVLVHGLVENESSWRLGPRDAEGRRPAGLGALLAAELGASPLLLRYNTGLHVSTNALALDRLLEATVQAWPVPVTRISLVGHSMGGLVLRGALHHGREQGHAWAGHVQDLVTLGTPHRGAPLEKATHVVGRALALLPETAPIATALRSRSAGVKDLRHGYLSDADWLGTDPDAALRDLGTELPLAEGVRHHLVAAVLTRDPAHPLGRLLGDLLVREASAGGRATRTRRVAFTPTTTHLLPGTHHFALLHLPAVHDVVLRCLRGDLEKEPQ